MSGNKKLFLSAVSSEFVSYRNLLAAYLKRPDLEVAVQEDFVVTGGTTLDKLDTYIRHCDAVIHLIGKAAGAVPEEPAVAALLAAYPDLGTRLPPLAENLRKPEPQFSYTQWEAYLAIYHRRPLFVYRPTDFELDALHVPRDARFGFSPSEAKAQMDHYRRISALGHDRGEFLNEERLSSAVLRDLVEILPRLESTVHVSLTKLRHTAERLIGRDEDLERARCRVERSAQERSDRAGLRWNGQDLARRHLDGRAGPQELAGCCARLRLVVLQPGHARAGCRIGGHLYCRGAAGLR
jgi:hypothetical protein